MRIRTIKPEWLEDELLALASSDARVLSVSLLLLADDYGNGRANVVMLAGRVFPGKPPETLAKALEELVELRFVVLYEVNGQRYFHVRNWEKHQKVDKPGRPQVPGPSPSERGKCAESLNGADCGESSRESRELSRETPETLATDQDQDQDQDLDHDRDHLARSRARAAEVGLGLVPRPTPERKGGEVSTVVAVLKAFEDAWEAATREGGKPGHRLGLSPNSEFQRATDLWRKAEQKRPEDPLALIAEAARAACAEPTFRTLGSPWAAFVSQPWRHLAGRPRAARGQAPPGTHEEHRAVVEQVAGKGARRATVAL